MAILLRATFLLCVAIALASGAPAPPAGSGGAGGPAGAAPARPGAGGPGSQGGPGGRPGGSPPRPGGGQPGGRPPNRPDGPQRPGQGGEKPEPPAGPDGEAPPKPDEDQPDSEEKPQPPADGEDGNEEDLPSEPCPDGQVRFSGDVTFDSEDSQSVPLPTASVLTLTLSSSAEQSAESSLHTEELPLPENGELVPVPYSFCVAIPESAGEKLSLVGQVTDKTDKTRVYYLGETVVAKGSTEYEADVSLVSLLGGSLNSPSIDDCGFAELPADVMGVAIRLSVTGSFKTLPQPSILVVTLRAPSEAGEEPDVVSVFSGDVSGLVQPGQPLPAFLCAKVPEADKDAAYSVQAALFVGWEGRENDGEERVPRKGDFVSSEDTKIQFVSGERDYGAEVALSPYEG